MTLLLAACQPNQPLATSAPTSQIIVRQLATVGPTRTPDATELQATQQAIETTPTIGPPTLQPSPEPYIGVFLGEAEVREINAPFFAVTPIETPTPRSPLSRFTCALDSGQIFGTRWASNAQALNGLRCPIQETFGFIGRVQVFEGGAIYWRVETNEFWLVSPSSLTGAGSHWKVDQPQEIPLPPFREVPQNAIIPQGPMKDAWLTFTEARAALGFAILPEQEIDVNLQRFEGGTLFLDLTVGQVFALLVDGSAIGPIDR